MSYYPQYFAVIAHNANKLWLWFRVAPRRLVYYFLGVVCPQLGITVLGLRTPLLHFIEKFKTFSRLIQDLPSGHRRKSNGV